jgi:Golgi SNAP receptor complex protein 2
LLIACPCELELELDCGRGLERAHGTLGQISTTLTHFNKLISDYSKTIDTEKPEKRTKALNRLTGFKESYARFGTEFEKAKSDAQERKRTELIGASGPGPRAGGMRQRGNIPSQEEMEGYSESPFARPDKAEHALNEHSFLQRSEGQIDDFLAQGRAVLDNLQEQRDVLRRSSRGLRGVGETLGLSRETIGWVERRT